MLGHHRSDGSKLVGKFKYTAWNSKFYDKDAIVKGHFFIVTYDCKCIKKSNFNNKLQKVIILSNPGSVRHFLVNSIILENVFCFCLVLGSSQPKLGTQMGPILLLQFFLLFPSLLLLSSNFFGLETCVLYQSGTYYSLEWKTFGNKKLQPKYDGETI